MKRPKPRRGKIIKSRNCGSKTADLQNLEVMLNEAAKLQQAGQSSKAAVVCHDILEQNPAQPDALQLLGIITYLNGDMTEAIRLFQKALKSQPDNPEAHNNLAIILNYSDRTEEALEHFNRSLAINPGYAEAHNNRANALRSLNRFADARTGFERAIELAPGDVQAHSNLGSVLLQLNDPGAARDALETALRLNPNYGPALSNLGAALQDLGEFDAALDVLDKALALNPNDVIAINNRGHVLQEMDQLDEAEILFRRAISLKPDYVDAYNNLGTTQQLQDRTEIAIKTFRQGLATHPENPDLHWNLALALLQLADYRNGWQEYEWRWRMPKFSVFKRKIEAQEWQGEDLYGKTIFVHAEQGLGDAIHFARYVPLVSRPKVRVLFECPKPLVSLLSAEENCCKFEIVAKQPTHCDVCIPLLSLPRIFDTVIETIPVQTPYLFAPAKRLAAWTPLFSGANGLKVGLVWAGNVKYQNDLRRSIPFELIEVLLQIENVTFYALQIERLEVAADAFDASRLINIGANFNDFADTAAAISNLDLVISVDTAVAHLAGAIGKPVWTMLPKASDWRWLLEREDTPWYPTMRLFRQPKAGDWKSVIERVGHTLREWSCSGRY